LLEVDLQHVADKAIYSMLVGGRSHEVYATREEGVWRILLDGERYEVAVEDERTRRLKELQKDDTKLVGDVQVKAPMPGMVVGVLVEVGQSIAANSPLIILEAMKMENEIRAPRAGTVKEIRSQPRQAVELDQVLLILGDEPE
jgi:biotin carboxyl carrier protein